MSIKVRVLTDQGLLAESLGLLEVVLPLEQGKGLVDEWEHIDAPRFAAALQLHRFIEVVNRLLELLLVKQKLSIIVVHIGGVLEVLEGTAECGHRRGNGAHLVLRHTELDVRVDEVIINVDGFLVVLDRFGEFAEDEMKLSAVVVDIWVILVLADGSFEILDGGFLLAYRYLLLARP